MKIEIEIKESELGGVMQSGLDKFFNSAKGRQFLEAAAKRRVDKVLTSEKLHQLAAQRMSRVITTDVAKALLVDYTEEKYANRMSDIIKNLVKSNKGFKDMVKNQVRAIIKIG